MLAESNAGDDATQVGNVAASGQPSIFESRDASGVKIVLFLMAIGIRFGARRGRKQNLSSSNAF